MWFDLSEGIWWLFLVSNERWRGNIIYHINRLNLFWDTLYINPKVRAIAWLKFKRANYDVVKHVSYNAMGGSPRSIFTLIILINLHMNVWISLVVFWFSLHVSFFCKQYNLRLKYSLTFTCCQLIGLSLDGGVFSRIRNVIQSACRIICVSDNQ